MLHNIPEECRSHLLHARSLKSCKTGNVCITACHGKAISITYSEYAFAALVIQHAEHMWHITLSSVGCPAMPYFSYKACKVHVPYYIVICGLSNSTILSHIISSEWFSEKVTEYKMSVLIYSTNFVWTISHSKNNSVRYHNCTCLHIRHPLFLSYFHETWIFSTDFKKYAITKFHEHPSSESWNVPCRWTDRHTEANSHFLQFHERT